MPIKIEREIKFIGFNKPNFDFKFLNETIKSNSTGNAENILKDALFKSKYNKLYKE